jgi:hypothetical protein
VVVGVVLAGRERHRRFSEAQKIAIIGETFFTWRAGTRRDGAARACEQRDLHVAQAGQTGPF